MIWRGGRRLVPCTTYRRGTARRVFERIIQCWSLSHSSRTPTSKYGSQAAHDSSEELHPTLRFPCSPLSSIAPLVVKDKSWIFAASRYHTQIYCLQSDLALRDAASLKPMPAAIGTKSKRSTVAQNDFGGELCSSFPDSQHDGTASASASLLGQYPHPPLGTLSGLGSTDASCRACKW